MNLIDTHFHLDLFPDPENLVSQIEKLRIYSIAVTNTPSVYHFTQEICSDKKYIRPALGLHPELAEERQKELLLFKELLNTTKYIGEIGLDNIKRCSPSSKRAQLKVFKSIVNFCSIEKNKILTVHSRGSEKEVIDIIGDKFPGKVILHWYSGNIKNLELGLKYGFYFSVNSAMCRSKKGLEILKNIPSSRLLTESDGPFIQNESKINTPLNMENTISQISEILNLSNESILEAVFKNFRSLLYVYN